jgi:hypothetical protein
MSEVLKTLNVGDTAYWSDVNSRDGSLSSGKVTKVGTKLVTVGHMVFRLDTLKANDDYQHQTLIPDIERYYEQKKTKHLSRALSEHLIHCDTKLSDLERIAEILGVKV